MTDIPIPEAVLGLVAATVALLGARYGVRARLYRKRLVVSAVVPIVSGALTLPLPFLPVVFVLYGRPRFLKRPEFGRKRVHEWAHVDQAVDWGAIRYLWRHVRARIDNWVETREFDMLVKHSDVEWPAYQREQAFAAGVPGDYPPEERIG